MLSNIINFFTKAFIKKVAAKANSSCLGFSFSITLLIRLNIFMVRGLFL